MPYIVFVKKIRLGNLLANKLIGDVKNVLQNSNSRKMEFVQSTGLALPPDVVLTRWGTWLNAAFYYGENFDKIKDFIDNLNGKSTAIRSVKNLMQNEDVQEELMNLMQFNFIILAIEKLESRGLKFNEKINILNEVQSKLTENVLNKLIESLKKNPDINTFRNSNKSFEFKTKTEFAPCVSVEVERSFSMYKNIIGELRTL